MPDDQLFYSHIERREDGKLDVTIKTCDALENLFKTDDTRESSEWHSGDDYHEFYHRDAVRDQNEELESFMASHYDNYGAEFLNQDGDVNLSLLRTVGISDGDGVEFVVPANTSEDKMMEALSQLKEAAIEMYKRWQRPVEMEVDIRKRELV